MLSSDLAEVIVDYIEELLRSRQFEVVVRSAHARRGTFRRGWRVGDVSSLTAVVRVRGLLRHPTRTRHNSNGFSRSTQKQPMKLLTNL